MSLKSAAKRLPFIHGLLHVVPPYHAGSIWENRVGYQVARTIGESFLLHLRSYPHVNRRFKKYLEIIERDGVVVIPDFLPEEGFLQVRAEFDCIKPELVYEPFRKIPNGRLHVARYGVSEQIEKFPHARRHVVENEMILQITAAVTKCNFTPRPYAGITVYRASSSGGTDNDIENVLHADVHYPTIKAFYYLNRVDASNGAFVYAKGSHRLTPGRLRHEYDLSVRTARLRRGDEPGAHPVATRGDITRCVISPEMMRAMNVVETSICGEANTLIISNNMGFHRRGEFTSAEPREVFNLNFRYLKGRPNVPAENRR